MEFLKLTTQDGLQLPAAYWPAPGAPGMPIDALMLNPGSAGNFYTEPIPSFARGLAAAGLPCLTLSTRGHDEAWRDNASGRRYGHAFESVGECVEDFRAALDELERLGHRRVAILGHSLGGLKVVYYQATTHDPRVAAIINCSGPRFSDRLFRTSAQADRYLHDRARAEALVAAGTPEAVFESTFPFVGMLFSARTYLAKYGTEDYDTVALASRLTTPVLMIIGEHEHAVTLDNVARDVVAAAAHAPGSEVHVIAGAGHFYEGIEGQLVARMLELARPSARRDRLTCP